MSTTGEQRTIPFLELYGMLPAGGIRGMDSDEFRIASRVDGFVAPTLRPILDPDDARIVLVSARGATGKSVLAQQLSAMKNAPLWRLDLDKTVSAHALDAKLNEYLGPDGTRTFKADGDALVIIDALDEARMRVTGLSWVEFLDSLVKVADAGRRLVLLGRERVLEDAWVYFDDAGTSCSWFEISHFAPGQRTEYVDKAVATHKNPPSGETYNKARDAVLDALAGSVEDDLAEAFVGYAPVLDAVVALLTRSNLITVINDFQGHGPGAERIEVLKQILERLLLREQEKTHKTAVELGLDPAKAYSRDEQIDWLTADLMDGDEPDLDWCPEEVRNDYVARIREFLRDHPFRAEDAWASQVFAGFVASERFDRQPLRDSIRLIGQQTGLLFEFVVASHGAELIDEWQFAALHGSLLAAEWQDVEAVVALQRAAEDTPIGSVSGELLLIEEESSRGSRFELVLEKADSLLLMGPTSFLTAEFPGAVEISPRGTSLALGPECYIRCRDLHINGETVEVARRAHVPGEIAADDPSVTLAVSGGLTIDGGLAGSPAQDVFEIAVPKVTRLRYPWVNYRVDLEPDVEQPNERAVRFLNMLMNLARKHGHAGRMAVYDKKLEGRQSIKRDEFSAVVHELETLGVVSHEGGLIFLQPDWEQHRYSGKGRPGLPTLDDTRARWAPVLERISEILAPPK